MATPAVSVRGLWHVALNVRDVDRAVAFYRDVFGMREVWRPDPDNAYLSSGQDNLALHRAEAVATDGALDHIGFIVASADQVFAGAARARERGVEIVKEPREHRDGSVSFYCRDSEGNVVQVLWLPAAMLRP